MLTSSVKGTLPAPPVVVERAYAMLTGGEDALTPGTSEGDCLVIKLKLGHEGDSCSNMTSAFIKRGHLEALGSIPAPINK